MIQKQLSHNTNKYIDTYSNILNDMKTAITNEFDLYTGANVAESFIHVMIPHQEAANKMCENLLTYTINIDLQNFTHNLIQTQKDTIEEMQGLLGPCANTVSEPKEIEKFTKMQKRIISNMFSKMEAATIVNSIDCDFVFEMIPLYLGSVEMAKNAQRYNTCNDLVNVLETIINLQTEAIKTLLQFKAKNCR